MTTVKQKKITDSVSFGNQFVYHKPQVYYAQILVGKQIYESSDYWQNFSSIGHRLTTQTNHLPKLLCAETAVTQADKTPLKSDALLNRTSNQLTRWKYSKCWMSSPSLAQIQAHLSLQSPTWSRSARSHQIWTDPLLLFLLLSSCVVCVLLCLSQVTPSTEWRGVRVSFCAL